MARTPSNMIPLGFEAPQFQLLEPTTQTERSLAELKSDTATLVIFMCNHCPFVIHVIDELVKLAEDYMPKSISFVAINSNDIANYPDDAPEKMVTFVNEKQIPFPYLFDETQEVAKAYDAACTPDFYLFDGDMKCVYRGQLDGSRPGNDVPVTGIDMRHAFDQLLKGEKISEDQMPSIGCNIKWKA